MRLLGQRKTRKVGRASVTTVGFPYNPRNVTSISIPFLWWRIPIYKRERR